MSLLRTVLDHPNRTPSWGDAKFPGNNNGYIQRDLIETFAPASVCDPMAGSGTTPDVCKAMEVPCFAWDLSHGQNIESPDTKLGISGNGPYDLIFWHPPYWSMVRYNLSDKRDFSAGTYFQYLVRMRIAMQFLANCLTPRGVLALQLGDYRVGGQTYFINQDCMKFTEKCGLVEEVQCIVVQHHTSSDGETDLPMRFGHEYLTILRRMDGEAIGTFGRTRWGTR